MTFKTIADIPNDIVADTYYKTEVTACDHSIKLTTHADEYISTTKELAFPFTDDDLYDAIVGLQCWADYAVCEGYEETHRNCNEK